MARKTKTVTPVIMGIHPQGEKRLLALHFHPDAIREHIKGMVEMSAEQPKVRPLFEDIEVLVNWALDRLQLVAPPKEKGTQPESETASQKQPK